MLPSSALDVSLMPTNPAVWIPRVLGIVGAGQLGAGIAQVAATHGINVVLCDTSASALTRGVGGITRQAFLALLFEPAD